jgi:hypothetical protein
VRLSDENRNDMRQSCEVVTLMEPQEFVEPPPGLDGLAAVILRRVCGGVGDVPSFHSLPELHLDSLCATANTTSANSQENVPVVVIRENNEDFIRQPLSPRGKRNPCATSKTVPRDVDIA